MFRPTRSTRPTRPTRIALIFGLLSTLLPFGLRAQEPDLTGFDPTMVLQMLTGGAPAQPTAELEAPEVPTGPKPSGVLRIGVVTPKAQLLQGNVLSDAGGPIQNALLVLMQGPAIQVVPLEARVSVQIAAEARLKECDFVLTSELSQRKRGGTAKKILRGVGRVLSPVASLAGNVAAPGLGGMMGGQILSGQLAGMGGMGGFGSQVKKKDEFTLTYELVTSEGSRRLLQQTVVARAHKDGEDVLMPLLQKAAESILVRATAGPVAPGIASVSRCGRPECR
jgi:hypothetical protein